jgi:hypothetical protein
MTSFSEFFAFARNKTKVTQSKAFRMGYRLPAPASQPREINVARPRIDTHQHFLNFSLYFETCNAPDKLNPTAGTNFTALCKNQFLLQF